MTEQNQSQDASYHTAAVELVTAIISLATEQQLQMLEDSLKRTEPLELTLCFIDTQATDERAITGVKRVGYGDYYENPTFGEQSLSQLSQMRLMIFVAHDKATNESAHLCGTMFGDNWNIRTMRKLCDAYMEMKLTNPVAAALYSTTLSEQVFF